MGRWGGGVDWVGGVVRGLGGVMVVTPITVEEEREEEENIANPRIQTQL